ncbi:MAG: glycine--tRNA ligase [Deltaproteobacteria bacterium]|nr:glycine--tRNA ligase [Deltaproteobacteria bacterium]
MSADLFEKIISLSKRRGFIVQSSEIYGGLPATYDYGPLGVELKRNVATRWWNAMVRRHEEIEGLDAAILMHPTVWKASGHVDAFQDPLIDDKASKMRYRADQLIEDAIEKLRKKKKTDKADALHAAYVAAMNDDDLCEALHKTIVDHEIRSPDSGAKDWSDVRQFNLMFSTRLGAVDKDALEIYLRPETAQGIFVNFNYVREVSRQGIPFGVAQIGKAFRNEIVARQFVFRMREFEQMEMEYFVKPGTQLEAFERWKDERRAWHEANGIDPEKLRFHVHDKLAHYADAAVDIEYKYPIGWREVEGIHSRTDFDLQAHIKHSGKKLEYFDPQTKERFVPFVVETSVGLDRTILMVLADAYEEEKLEKDTRTVLHLHPKLAPLTCAVFPLVKKEGMPETARKIVADLSEDFRCFYDEKGAVGRRYRRMDEVGTPFCITIDGQTHEDNTVTVRERDSMVQTRVAADRLDTYLRDAMKTWKRPGA